MAKGKTTSRSKAAPAKAAAKKPAKAPVKAAAKGAGKAVAKTPVKPVKKVVAPKSAKAVKAPAKAAVKKPTKATAKTTTKAPAKAPAKAAPVKAASDKVSSKTNGKAPQKTVAPKKENKTAGKTVGKPAAKPETKAIAKPAPKQPENKVFAKAPEKVKVVEKHVAKDSAILSTGGLMPPDYDPTKDKGDFMNPIMKEFFRLKLISWREELIRESSDTIHNTLQSTELQKPDLADRAAAETDHALELRTRDRERKLISKINEALLRLEDDSYGYCEETGEPISVARLVARPTATLSLEAQERHERMEKTHRDD